MAKIIINNGDTGLVVRNALNSMFTELYNPFLTNDSFIGTGVSGSVLQLTGIINNDIKLLSTNHQYFSQVKGQDTINDKRINGSGKWERCYLGNATLGLGSWITDSAPTSLTNNLGNWNATTNSPTIVSGLGNSGDWYTVSVNGTTTIDGINEWFIGDYIWFDSTLSKWQKINNQSTANTSSPGGTSQDIQFNDNGTFGGSTSFRWLGNAIQLNSTEFNGEVFTFYDNTEYFDFNFTSSDTQGQFRLRNDSSLLLRSIQYVSGSILTTDEGLLFYNFNTHSPNYYSNTQLIDISDHNQLKNVFTASVGVTYGHINYVSQSIYGQKTFINSPIVPIPTSDYQVANKVYVDNNSSHPAGNNFEIQFNSGSSFGADSNFVWNNTTKRLGIGRNPLANTVEVGAEQIDDTNYISILSETDKTRGFSIDDQNGYKWVNYVYDGEDGDNLYLASGNSVRDILTLQSGGRMGLNVPTLIGDIQVYTIVQTSLNTYATVTCEVPHKLANNTPIEISGATNTKFNGNWIISNITTMTFRINGVDVGAVTEDPSPAKIIMETTIPSAFSVFPQYFDSIFTFDKSLDTGVGTGFADIAGNMRTSFGTADVIVPATTGSYLYIGKKYPWRATNFNIATATVGSTAITVEYSTETGWTALLTSTTSGNSLVDGTSRLVKDGNITWNLKTFKDLWKTQILQVNTSPAMFTSDLYWIRISLTGTITTAPTAKAIGNHGVDRFSVYSQASDINPAFTIDALGRVIISPSELDTKYSAGNLGGLSTGLFEVLAEDANKSDYIYYLANDNTSSHSAVIMAKSRGTIAAKTAVANGDDLGAIYGYAYDGTMFREGAGILFENVGTPVAGSISGRIAFRTRNTTSLSTERMRINENGDVAIGTTDTDGNPIIGRLIIKGSTNNGTTNILVGRDSDEINVFSIDTDGNANFNTVNATNGIKSGFVKYTNTFSITSTNQITLGVISDITSGMGLKLKLVSDSNYYYFVIRSISGLVLTVEGNKSLSGTIEELWYCNQSNVTLSTIPLDNLIFSVAASDVQVLYTNIPQEMQFGHIVSIRTWCRTQDTGVTRGKIDVRNTAGNSLYSTDTDGISFNTNTFTSSGVSLNSSNTLYNYGEVLRLYMSGLGSNKDTKDAVLHITQLTIL